MSALAMQMTRVVQGFTRDHCVLFLVGVGLSIAQFIMIRDFVTVLYGEEVVIVLVTAAFLAGLSVGYLLSLRLASHVFKHLFIISVFLHLTFPLSYRYLAAWFAQMNAGGAVYLALLFTYALLFSSIFAAFLPRLVSLAATGGSEEERLKTFYTVELIGFVAGFVVIGSTWNHPLIYLLPVYWLILAILLHLVVWKPAVTAGYVVAATVACLFLNQTDIHSTQLLYEYKHHWRSPTVLYSVNSPYQKVEVIDDGRGGRSLYLDGLENLNSTDLEGLNFYIAQVPAALIKPERTLIIGNGTLSSVPKVYPHSGEVISVELDPAVLEAGRLFFTPPEKLKGLDRWQLHVDDGKHFLMQSEDTYDLIIMDVPSPLTIQEAFLHTVEFYQLAQSRLNERGVIAVQLSGDLERNNRTPARVVAALREAFPGVMVISSPRADRGFAYASMTLPFTAADVRRESQAYEQKISVIPPSRVRRYQKNATPLSVDHLDLVLRRGLERFLGRYFDD